jgi:Protein of unknown function (DUF3987)/Bifunctional DNA primase/polymerase, N-terminal
MSFTPEAKRLQLLSAGFAPVALIGKAPLEPSWQLRHDPTEYEVKNWSRSAPAAVNTGILARLTPLIDIDILNEEAAKAVEGMVRERFEEMGHILVKFGRFPKRGIPFRTNTPFAKMLVKVVPPGGSDEDPERIDLLADGQQFVVHGIHPDTLKPFSWHGGEPGEIKHDDLPYIHEEEARALVDDAAKILIEQFGYRLATKGHGKAKANGAGAHEPGGSTDWTVNFGDHDELAAHAMKLLRSGMKAGAVVNLLRQNVEALTDIDPDRRARRLSEIVDMVTSAEAKIAGEVGVGGAAPTPLGRKSAPGEPYPIDALGEVLGPAARAIAGKVQVPPAMAAQSVLGVASLAAQGQADVLLPFGQTRPLSVFALTIADSGDRKTSADKEAMIPVRMREKKLSDQYKILKEIYDIDHAGWHAERTRLERDGKMDKTERAAALQRLGPEPIGPIEPFLTINEGTTEGILKLMPKLPGALGLFSAEAGSFLAGHGFTEEAKRRTAAGFSGLWDGDGLRSVRASDGLRHCPGRRVALCLMIQPDGARGVLSDQVLRGQGFLARLLLAGTDSMAGTRLWQEPATELEPALKSYTAHILEVFEAPQLCGDKPNELTPSHLTLDPEARTIWIAFHNEVELDMAAGKRVARLKDVGAKASEQAARIAGVLTIVRDPYARVIRVEDMARGCTLMRWYLGEALRLAEEYIVPEEIVDAQAILDWVQERGLPHVDAATLQKSGPGPVRRRERFYPAIEALVAAGWFTPAGAQGKARGWVIARA